jgi:hypothetical protein
MADVTARVAKQVRKRKLAGSDCPEHFSGNQKLSQPSLELAIVCG